MSDVLPETWSSSSERILSGSDPLWKRIPAGKKQLPAGTSTRRAFPLAANRVMTAVLIVFMGTHSLFRATGFIFQNIRLSGMNPRRKVTGRTVRKEGNSPPPERPREIKFPISYCP